MIRSLSGALFVALVTTAVAGCYESHLPAGMVDVPDECVATTERCDGVDDDCDGRVDEGTGRALGCGVEACIAGECLCPADRLCDGECVDTSRAVAHCGSCDHACLPGLACVDGACCAADVGPVDMLFMVDNSNSMSEEQASLAEAFPLMMTIFASGDLDGDGEIDFAPIDDLHVGVVTSDMGTGGNRVPTCTEPDFGDDGRLRTQPSPFESSCMLRYPPFLTFETGAMVSSFVEDFSCVARVGTGGCGLEQQLEAVLKALTPSTSPIRFFRDTPGHGDSESAGFLRSDSVLAVIVVTDENDCSALDPDLINPGSETYTGDLNLRCFAYPAAAHPVSRYVNGLLALRSRPENLVFAQITGVPSALAAHPASPDFDAILSDSAMVERVDPSLDIRLTPSCDVAGRGFAFPPRRIVETARGLAARGAQPIVGSICQADFTDTIAAIADDVAHTVYTACE